MNMNSIIDYLENLAPKELAEEWDNVGLLIGRVGEEITKVLVCLDFDKNTLEQAIEQKCELIITHHPAIFKPINALTNPLLLKAVSHNIAVYSCHTNLDTAEGGVNDALAQKLGLKCIKSDAILRFGSLNEEMTEKDFCEYVKTCLDVSTLRINNIKKTVKKVGVVGGSGADFMELAVKNGCDAFLTGEASYHEAQAAENEELFLVCAGHFETEVPVVPVLSERIQKEFPEIEVVKGDCINPFVIDC